MARKPAFTYHSREREAQIQSRMLDALSARFRRRLAAEIYRESEDILLKYKELGHVAIQSDVHYQEIKKIYTDLSIASSRLFGRRFLSLGKRARHVIEVKSFEDLFKAIALAWVNNEHIRRRITHVSDTTRSSIISIIERGQNDGLGVSDIAMNITKVLPSISRTRGALIARTETHGAANNAAYETAKSTGLELEKEWISVEDDRTRSVRKNDYYDHSSMDGQKRKMEEPFDMPTKSGGVLKAMHPGELGLPGGAFINCRCAVAYSVAGIDD